MLLAIALFLIHCGPSPIDEELYETAQENAVANLASSSYEEQGSAYGCTTDCSGHEAGYAWAAENSVTDASECRGSNVSFTEGCMAFAEAVQSETETLIEENETEF